MFLSATPAQTILYFGVIYVLTVHKHISYMLHGLFWNPDPGAKLMKMTCQMTARALRPALMNIDIPEGKKNHWARSRFMLETAPKAGCMIVSRVRCCSDVPLKGQPDRSAAVAAMTCGSSIPGCFPYLDSELGCVILWLGFSWADQKTMPWMAKRRYIDEATLCTTAGVAKIWANLSPNIVIGMRGEV
ncbi:uncharacterized protein MYCFIDRAFT_174119 [Pseudocercospora fijiensis CIRAD86]|uniref:Uncharacterized protein n=1 Tax=Pseudocercospora fijiensis (strain CIRAD86) TaxID=383855 RepID=M3AZF2_PSEFD|nr:uncharacterized protein MYCFIDRAFT_174119 [Pseudocercospora fijiensis CIRAD86]EME82553.1 hypothetical protein MYCFIDRAFT_174119 [Pseudocercospora fijiensis CIRAD86]